MKNGKAPTREQKKIMKAHGLVPENWLVVKNLPDSLEVVSRVSLKKVGGKPKTRKTEQGVSSSRFSACAGSQKRPDAFQVSSRRSNRLSRIYGSMRTLPGTKEPVRCCMRS